MAFRAMTLMSVATPMAVVNKCAPILKAHLHVAAKRDMNWMPMVKHATTSMSVNQAMVVANMCAVTQLGLSNALAMAGSH